MNDLLGDVKPSWVEEDCITTVESPKKKLTTMSHFWWNVDEIKADIEAISQAARTIDEINEKAMRATTSAQEMKLSQKLQEILGATNKRAKRTKKLLELLEEESAKLERSKKLRKKAKLNDSDIRIRKNLRTTLTKKFVEEMKLYQQAQEQYKAAIKAKAQRQVRAIMPHATDEDVEQVMRSEGGKDTLLKEVILANGINSQVETTYAKVAGKYQDILALEQSVGVMHQMFLDLALLTEQQGELLDQIEFQVNQAKEYADEGNDYLVKAIEFQKKIRKKQCRVMGIAATASALLLLFAL